MIQTFEETGIRPELLRAITELGYESPMPVQQQVIPVILQGHQDIIALAQTGTGKTAAFGLPLISNIDEKNKNPQVLILCPTRELCIQITNDLSNYGKYISDLQIVAVYGGASIENQIKQLRQGAQVIAATPGRMNDLIRRKKVNLEHIHSVVLDEADEMLNMGFQEEINTILEVVPKERRTLLFSATMPREVATIAAKYMIDAREITVGTKNAGAENVKHHYYVVHASDRYVALKRIADYFPDIYGIIFCRTRQETNEVAEKLMKDGYNADALHGDLSQQQRDYVMQRFRVKNIQMLVATDVAARGLDVDDLTHVINYNLPDDVEIYTHRSGRTGRAGKSGISISICHTKEKFRLAQIEKMIKQKFELKLVPSGKEICEKQLFSLIDRMEKVEVNEDQIAEFLPVILKKLEWLSREELLKKFVSTEFNRFLEYYKNAPDINVSAYGERREGPSRSQTAQGFTLLRINLGKMDGFNPRELIGMINDYTRDRSIVIGKADIQKSFTLFEIESSKVDSIFRAFKGIELNGRRIFVERSREFGGEPREYKRKEYGSGERSFGGDRSSGGRRYGGDRPGGDRPAGDRDRPKKRDRRY
jgi:ATP-dependent RNA helicase DeaD